MCNPNPIMTDLMILLQLHSLSRQFLCQIKIIATNEYDFFKLAETSNSNIVIERQAKRGDGINKIC